jgi:hypothetical protein
MHICSAHRPTAVPIAQVSGGLVGEQTRLDATKKLEVTLDDLLQRCDQTEVCTFESLITHE